MAMTPTDDPAREASDASYHDLLGFVPDTVGQRWRLAQATGRRSAVEAIERFRLELIHRNPLDPRTQQLVHFGMLIARGEAAPARLHAAGAVKAGATLRELQGVAETAAVVCGMPGFGLAVEVISDLHLPPLAVMSEPNGAAPGATGESTAEDLVEGARRGI